MITTFKTTDTDFASRFDALLSRGAMDIEGVSAIVLDLLKAIRTDGNAALREQIARFDRWAPQSDTELAVDPAEMKRAYEAIDPALREALQLAYDRIRDYHEKLMPKTWMETDATGSVLGQKVTPVDRAGLYIPGGKAAYPSSLLMNVIPAQVAGVEEIVVCTPAPDNELNELLLAACHLCGVEKVFKVGGASAVGAMAYGTETIPKVDVITGPGNIFVATAKKLVYGEVNIDMIAGPSEIGVLADHTARADWLAMDLLSQAEHDEMASSILITPDAALAEAVAEQIESFLGTLSRESIARTSIDERGAIIVTRDMDEAVDLMNRIAPEHLEVMTEEPMRLLESIKHAGAIFLGSYTPEPIGDYIAGPNHTLPTGGTARFYSPLSVEHFLKKSSIISMSEAGIDAIGEECAMIAHTEGLTAHEASVRLRLTSPNAGSQDAKRFKGLDSGEDLLDRLGIELGGEKIQIDLGKTKGFFDALQTLLKTKARKLQDDIAEGSVDLGENVGIKVDNERIDIDLTKTKSFIEQLGNTVETLVKEIDGAVKEVTKR
jgi:histidinol dehydrogenase